MKRIALCFVNAWLLLLVGCGGGGGGSTSPPAIEPPPAPTTPPPATPQALANPIAANIEYGDITVSATKFVRAPETEDAATPAGTTNAYARLQYLQEVPDNSGRLFFNDARGILYVTDKSGADPQTYLDIREQSVGIYPNQFPNESGFLGFAVHPDFAIADKPGFGKLYTSFSANPDGEADFIEEASSIQESVLYEWTTNDPQSNVFQGSNREVLRVGQFRSNHNIGNVAFNPNAENGDSDYGMLYLSLGDGGGAHDPRNHGQNKQSPLGALLRIDPLGREDPKAYGIPNDNPSIADAITEMWAYGLRHPQHFSWDNNGQMYILDIGQDQIEEVNLGNAGANYGWRLREGTFATVHGVNTNDRLGGVYERPDDPTDYEYPVAQYDHDEGFAIGSGFVYRGSAIPELVGKFVFCDLVRGRVFYIDTEGLTPGEPATILELRLVVDGEEQTLVQAAGYANPYSHHSPHTQRVDLRISADRSGELYLLTKGDGWVRKLEPEPAT